MTHVKIVEFSTYQQWLEWRRKGIGGSDAPIVMQRSPWATPLTLWLQKTRKDAPPIRVNSWMRRGKDLEPLAREEYQHMTGMAMPAQCVENVKRPILRVSFDGRNGKARKGLEIKCPGRVDHLTARKGRVPDKYHWQCIHALLSDPGLDSIDYFSFDGVKGVIVPFERNKKVHELSQKLLAKELAFWKLVERNIPPAEVKDTFVDEFRIFKIRGRR